MNRRAFLKQMMFLLTGSLVAGCVPREQDAPRYTPTTNAAKLAVPTSTVVYSVALPPTKPAAIANATATRSGPQPATVSALQTGTKLTILHTNDSNGYVDPCG
jgi:hypothetical protein